MRLLPAGDRALLVELASLEETLALHDGLRTKPLEGVEDLVPAARTLLIRHDPALLPAGDLAGALARIDLTAQARAPGRRIEIPVHYDGEDLGEVAALLGLPVADLVRRHGEAEFTVAFIGFAPGFAYLACDDPLFDVPRRTTPRVRIAAGSVALGGRFSGVYPSDSPGGWQLIGRTPLRMWDMGRDRPALLAPGDRVRFRDIAGAEVVPVEADLPEPPVPSPAPGLRVLRTDRPALFQDLGRPGQAAQGVAVSGALDRAGLRAANRCLGNPADTPALEVAYGGTSLRAEVPVTLAVTGAPCPLTLITREGSSLALAPGAPFALDAGETLTLGLPASGTRSYIALRGGFAVPYALGSAATDTLAKIGPKPAAAGDVLVPGDRAAGAVLPGLATLPTLPRAGGEVTLDILLGPRDDWFTERGLRRLLETAWEVTPEASRTGMRLSGPEPVERRDRAELPSEGTVPGSIQIPHSGQPVLFLADHPLTGGYPVIAVVAAHHLDLAGQIPIGARIRFRALPAPVPLPPEVSR